MFEKNIWRYEISQTKINAFDNIVHIYKIFAKNLRVQRKMVNISVILPRIFMNWDGQAATLNLFCGRPVFEILPQYVWAGQEQGL